MNELIRDFVSFRTEPDFFDDPDDTFEIVHGEIKHCMEMATEIVTVTVDLELMQSAEKKLAEIGWTLEEAFILFLYWCVTNPNAVGEWARRV